jgi:peptidoglycan lytic transglycosylase
VSAENETKRKLFVKAEKHVWQAKSSHYQTMHKQLMSYPLLPYLDQKKLMHKIRLTDAKEIRDFLANYQASPLDWPLRKKWLFYLAKKQRKTMFLDDYKPTSNVKLRCYFYRFQLDSGLSEQVVLPKVTKLWLVGKSQPKVCDPLFERWQKAGYRTENVIWQRVKLAAKGGKHTLIPYLTKLLPKKQQYIAKLWHKVRRDPGYVRHLSKFPIASTKAVEVITYGLKRLIWRDANRALRVYKKAKQKFIFSNQQQQYLTQKFAQALASKKHRDAGKWLAQVEQDNLTDNLVQWRLVEVLKQQNWQVIKAELNALPSKFHDNLQWKYWYARSLLATNEQSLGKMLLSNLAQKRHYYGFLAASYLNKSINIENKPLVFTAQQKQQVLQKASAKRAFELFYLQRYNLARREWHYWLSQLSKQEKLIAAKVANERGWFDRAIFTLAEQGYLDDVNLRFPEAYSKEINFYATKSKISPNWAFAIARRESSFMSDAHSGAGAYGLMQMLPSTAKFLLRQKRVSSRYLFEAKNNIKLGTKYLRKLLSGQHGNFVLATAAYNAGPYRVKAWLKKQEKIPADIWIETIPYKETRDYVKSVLAYQQIYQARNGNSQTLFNQVIAMEIGI